MSSTTAPAHGVPAGAAIERTASDPRTIRRVGAAALVAAPLMMVAGAVALATTGVSFDEASQAGTVGEILGDITANRTALTVTFSLWLAAMPVFAIAARLLDATWLPALATRLASATIGMGAALAAVAFVAFLTVVHAAAPAGAADVAVALTYLASTADWIATILIVGLGPVALVAFGGSALPRWLRPLSVLLAIACVATLVALVSGTGLTTFGSALVPVGIVATVAVGVSLWRQA